MHSGMRESEWNHYTGIHRTLHESIKFSSHQMMSLWPWIVTDSKSKSVLLGSYKNYKPRSNDCNISTQHIVTLFAQHLPAPAKRSQHLNAPYRSSVRRNSCARLAILLQIARTWPNDYNIMQNPQMWHKNLGHFQIWANSTKHIVAEDKCPDNLEQVHWFSSALWNNMPVKV